MGNARGGADGRQRARSMLRLAGGKSGLPKATVPGNARAGQPDGQRHRKQTALRGFEVRLLQRRVRVKRWGKSPPPGWQQSGHGKPHREQCQIGTACRASGGAAFAPAGPGWQLEGPWQRGLKRNGHLGAGNRPRQNPAYSPSAHFLVLQYVLQGISWFVGRWFMPALPDLRRHFLGGKAAGCWGVHPSRDLAYQAIT